MSGETVTVQVPPGQGALVVLLPRELVEQTKALPPDVQDGMLEAMQALARVWVHREQEWRKAHG